MLSALALAVASNANFTVAKVADEWGTIQPGGPRGATSGKRYWNIEGSSAGTYASTGTFRLCMADVKAQFDNQLGAGNWTVSNVNIVFEHSDAAFSATGGMSVYLFDNDALAITNGQDSGAAAPGDFGTLSGSPLYYQAGASALDTCTAGSTDANTIFRAFSLVDQYTFTPEGNDDIDVLGNPSNPLDPTGAYDAGPNYGVDLPGGFADSAALLAAELSSSGSNLNIAALAADIEGGSDARSLLLRTDAATAATYKGDGFDTLNPPRIYISAVPEPASFVLLALGGLAALRRR